jgi:hypothetical protein
MEQWQLEEIKNNLYYSGSSINLYIGGTESQPFSGLKLSCSYVQFSPNQTVLPVYGIYSSEPTLFGQGNSIARGTIGFNFTLATYLTGLANEEDAEYYEGSKPTWKQKVTVMDNGSIYVPMWKIVFVGNTVQTIAETDVPVIVPTITLYDTFFTGGVMTGAPDGNPVQDIYQFISKSYRRDDIKTDVI